MIHNGRIFRLVIVKGNLSAEFVRMDLQASMYDDERPLALRLEDEDLKSRFRRKNASYRASRLCRMRSRISSPILHNAFAILDPDCKVHV